MWGISSNEKLVNKNLSSYNSLSFDKFNTLYKGKYNTTLDPNWLGWFVGFAEGDGYLGINEGRPVSRCIIRFLLLHRRYLSRHMELVNLSLLPYNSLSFNKFNTLRWMRASSRIDKLSSQTLFSNINKRRFSVLSKTRLDPYYITGLTDARP